MRHKPTIAGLSLLVIISYVCFHAIGQATPTQKDEPIQQTSETPTPPPAQTVVLKEGTEINLKFAQKLSAKSAFVGEPVELVLARDLKVGDVKVVKQGARVLGTVVAGKESEKKRNEARQLAMRVDFLKVGDKTIRLRGEKAAEGKRNKNAMIEGTVLLGLSGLLMTSGKHYEIPEGSSLTAYVDEDVEVPVLSP
jgi:hypothetical protein